MAQDAHRHRSPSEELRHLEQLAEEGWSGETPLIVGAATFVVILVVFLVVLALALLAYRLA